MRLLAIKLFLTLLVTLALVLPFIVPAYPLGKPAVLAEVEAMGNAAWLIAAGFLVAVFLYCQDLEAILRRVKPEHRAAQPKSVWLMFLIPYNFIEDFFIVHHVTQSIEAEAGNNPRLSGLHSYGRYSSFLWCGAQILAIAPSILGHVASMVALLAWMAHWSLVRRVNHMLALDE